MCLLHCLFKNTPQRTINNLHWNFSQSLYLYTFVLFDLFCNEIKGEEVNPTEVEVAPTICEQIWYGLGQVGDFLFKNSYILNNIIMMVLFKNEWNLFFASKTKFLRISVMEHRVSQLDNVYIFAVGKSVMDHTESTEEHAALCSFCGFLCRISPISTVSVWNGSNRGGATFENRSNTI